MKENIKKFLSNGRGIILAIFILELILFIFVTPNKYDDEAFLEMLQEKSVYDIVSYRYSTWTSRVIIDYILFTLLTISKYAWIIVQAGMMTLIGYSISKLFLKNENKNDMNIIVLMIILIYPMNIMSESGWAATTANYMWPLATMLFALIPIRKAWDGEKFKWFQYALFALSAFYAGNQEQTCSILVGIYLVYTILFILKDKKVHPAVIMQFVISIASIIFILTNSGNYARQEAEIIENYPNFNMLTIQDKISLGLTTTINIIFTKNSIPFGIFSFMIVAYIWVTYKEKLYRVVSAIPFVSICVLGYFYDITSRLFPYLKSFMKLFSTEGGAILTGGNANNMYFAMPVIFSFVIFVSLLFSILLIFKTLKNNVASLVYLVGLASRLMMGFSPTLFASGTRTTLFLDFAMLIVVILIWQEFAKKTDKSEVKLQKKMEIILKCTGILQYINCLMFILITQK